MKFLISTMITLALLIGYTVTLSAQYSQLNQLFKKSDIRVEQCSCGGSCAVISTTSPPTYAMRSSGNSVWNQPIRVRFTVDDQIQVNDQILRDALAEDSQIAIDEGLYCGEGSAYVYAGQEPLDLTELSDAGIPIRTDAVVALMSSIDDPSFGTIFDAEVINARECWGAHKTIALIRNTADGTQESVLRGSPPSENFHPGEAYKVDAYSQASIRNHAISHSGGDNHPQHQNGPDITKRPIDIPAGRSYGWGPQGNDGFSGGNALGPGTNGENLASHIIAGHASWLVAIPNLTVSLDLPLSANVGDPVTMTATSNKDIGAETWEWNFTNGNVSFGAADSGNSTMENMQSQTFSEPGTWTVEVCISNECDGQVDCATATIEVISSNTAPVAQCQPNFLLSLDDNGLWSVTPDELNDSSLDPDGDNITFSITGTSNGDCADIGELELTLVVTDTENASDQCTTTLSLVDDSAPLLSTQDLTVEVAEGSMTTIAIEDLVTSVTDNCSVLTPSAVMADRSLTFQDTEKGQMIPVELSVSDDSDNVSTEIVTVTVTGTTTTVDNTASPIQLINPVQDELQLLNVTAESINQIDIYDLSGKLLLSAQHTTKVRVTALPAGLYVLRLRMGEGILVRRFVRRE